MDGVFTIAAISFFVGGVLFFIAGISITSNEFRNQAFERGHMVECLGKTGYHWECE